jgi:hypothetical protein
MGVRAREEEKMRSREGEKPVVPGKLNTDY